MRLPSKIISFRESSLNKFPILLSKINERDWSPCELYEQTKGHFEGFEDYIDTLDALFAINKITFDWENGRITNVI